MNNVPHQSDSKEEGPTKEDPLNDLKLAINDSKWSLEQLQELKDCLDKMLRKETATTDIHPELHQIAKRLVQIISENRDLTEDIKPSFISAILGIAIEEVGWAIALRTLFCVDTISTQNPSKKVAMPTPSVFEDDALEEEDTSITGLAMPTPSVFEDDTFPEDEALEEDPSETTGSTLAIVNEPSKDSAVDKAKERFDSAGQKVTQIQAELKALGWTFPFTKARARKIQLEAELKEAENEKTSATQALRAAQDMRKARAKAPETAPSNSPTNAGIHPTEDSSIQDSSNSSLATIGAEIRERIEEGRARQIAQDKEAQAQAAKENQALEAARTQKEAALAKAKVDLAKMSGMGGFFRSMFNWGEKERLEAKVARLTAELSTPEKPVAQAPAKPEHTPGFLEWFRTSTAARVGAVLVAGSLIGAAFSMKNGTHSTDSTRAPIATSLTPETSTLDLPTEPTTPTTAPLAEKTSFTPEPGNTIWDAAQDAGLTGEDLAKTTNDIVVQAYTDTNGSLGEHLNNPADFQKVVKQMTSWGGYTKVLESAEGQTTIAGFLNAVEQAHGEKVADLVEANIASTFNPMDAPHAPSMIKAALGAHK